MSRVSASFIFMMKRKHDYPINYCIKNVLRIVTRTNKKLANHSFCLELDGQDIASLILSALFLISKRRCFYIVFLYKHVMLTLIG